MKSVTTKFKSGGLHEKHVVATWKHVVKCQRKRLSGPLFYERVLWRYGQHRDSAHRWLRWKRVHITAIQTLQRYITLESFGRATSSATAHVSILSLNAG